MAMNWGIAVPRWAWMVSLRTQIGGSSALGRPYSGFDLYVLGIMLVKVAIVRPSITLFQVLGK